MTKALIGLKEVSAALGKRGIEDAGRESELIVTSCLGLDRVGLYRDNPVLSECQEGKLQGILERRFRREPLQYIIGHVEFSRLKMTIGPGVLIPRPETELMVDRVIQSVACRRQTAGLGPRILDLCTGSGCLALALAKHFPGAEVFGTDISAEALQYARQNASINSIGNVTFLEGDLYEPVKGIRFDIIVSNPPYIRRSDIGNLQPEIREWEPREALDGGEDGLIFYGEILSRAKEYLGSNGFMVMELGEGQTRNVIEIAENSGFGSFSVSKDYSGVERFLILAF